jgi:hypothetical protein
MEEIQKIYLALPPKKNIVNKSKINSFKREQQKLKMHRTRQLLVENYLALQF